MRAVVNRRYGGPEVVEWAELPDPAPQAGELLVRVEASDLSTADAALRSGSPFAARLFAGPRRPRLAVLGADFAGMVAAVGDGVTRFAVGDAVWGATGAAMGAHAEFVVVAEDGAVALRPAALTATDAASLVDATAMSFLRDTARLQPGERILINGASGAVGTAAVQLAVDMGAEVTAVCSAARARPRPRTRGGARTRLSRGRCDEPARPIRRRLRRRRQHGLPARAPHPDPRPADT